MAKIPPMQRLQAESFKEQIGWIAPLLSSMNDFMERITSALNKSLTIKENFAGDIKDVTLDGTFPVRIAWDQSVRPSVVLVGQVSRNSGVLTLTSAVQVQWQFNQSGQLQIDAVTSISPTPDDKYTLKLVCLS